MASAADITKHWPIDPDENPWVAGHAPSTDPIEIVEPDPAWPAQYEALAARIRDALGDAVLDLEHVGSTSVPGLAAKPIIDIDLTVADNRDEAAYVPHARGRRVRAADPRAGLARAPLLRRDVAAALQPARVEPGQPGGDPPPAAPRLAARAIPTTAPATPPPSARRPTATNAGGGQMMAYNPRKEPVLREILDRVFRAHGLI